jgi:hypothetical protein
MILITAERHGRGKLLAFWKPERMVREGKGGGNKGGRKGEEERQGEGEGEERERDREEGGGGGLRRT